MSARKTGMAGLLDGLQNVHAQVDHAPFAQKIKHDPARPFLLSILIMRPFRAVNGPLTMVT